ncbi:hypothetical protein KCMC57_up01560 [Kitasatospora sp. CMC57]|uniref:DUF11 domain-containing protein n=1 Tax=Kitasatospora sp. CMC57 TaxID=3231513 RepID=A0AB33JQN9_9ACTN
MTVGTEAYASRRVTPPTKVRRFAATLTTTVAALALVGVCTAPAGSAVGSTVGCEGDVPGPLVQRSPDTRPNPFAAAPARTPECRAQLHVPLADPAWQSLGSGTEAAAVEAQSDVQALGRVRSSRVAPGETFRYTITVFNRGPSAARDVQVTDRLPKALAFVSSADGCTANGQKVTCGPLPLLAPLATASWVILVRLDPAYGGTGSDIANQATVVSGTPDPVPADNTGPHPGAGLPDGSTTGPVADLTISKKPAGTKPVAPGETFDYLITVVNHGPSTAATVTVTDQLPTMLSFVSSTGGCTGPADSYGATLACPAADSLEPAASKTYPVTVRLDPAYDGDGSDVVNRATVSSATPDQRQDDNTATATGLPNPDAAVHPAPPAADLSIAAADTPAVRPGERTTARFTVTNHGPSTRRKPATVVITMPEHTTVPASGLPPECTASDSGRQVQCILAPGALSVSLPVLVAPSAPPTATLGGGTAVVRGPEDGNPANDSAIWTVPTLAGSADLETTKRAVLPAGRTSVTPGDVFTYRVTVTNHGPSDARAVTITDPLPAPLALVSASDGCTATGRTVTCRPTGPLAVGGTAGFDLTVRLAADFRGTGRVVDNIATAVSDTPDPVPANNSNQAGTTGPDGGPLPVTIPPTPTPTPKPTRTPTPVPAPKPTSTTTSPAPPHVPGRGELPGTGADLPGWLPPTTAGFLLAGAAGVLLARRLRRATPGRHRAGS